MGKLSELFHNVCSNDIRAINESIDNVGRKHHAEYMSDMMFTDDVIINYRLLSEIQNTVNSLYIAVSENYAIKQNAQDMLESRSEHRYALKQDFKVLTNEQLFAMVYQQAMKYYFRIDVENDSDFHSYFDEAIQFRIKSNFLKNEMEQILTKMYEDIEIVKEDTYNIEFLVKNYKKLNKKNKLFAFVLQQLEESIQNVIFEGDRYDQDYFMTVRKISFSLKQNFYGG